MAKDDTLHKIALIRGAFLQFIIEVEHYINEAIAFHFCGSDVIKRSEAIGVIFGSKHLQFNAKKEIFSYILKNHYPNYSTNKLLSDKNLTNLINIRNSYAHHMFINDPKLWDTDSEWVLFKLTTQDNKNPKFRTTTKISKSEGSKNIELAAATAKEIKEFLIKEMGFVF